MQMEVQTIKLQLKKDVTFDTVKSVQVTGDKVTVGNVVIQIKQVFMPEK